MTTDALDRIRAEGGAELAERLEHLDRTRERRARDAALAAPDAGAGIDADVVMLGGGLSLLVAAELARRGLDVVVLERARAGAAHREWNASGRELEVLVDAGIVDAPGLEALIAARYDHGVCWFHGGEPRRVTGVLDHAVDAGPLLERVRAVCEERGVRFVDRAVVRSLGASADAVAVGWDGGGPLTARVVVDARGASSPYATADLLCPTVGGVVRGLEHDPRVGDILVTTEDAVNGRQHVWEGFPGRAGELTTYLFYYARAADLAGQAALVPLYARFFTELPRYRRGTPELVRPTFGYIPGWSRTTPAPRGPSPRVVLVGDAAARHSPLTFCGFGSMLRSFQATAARIARLLEAGKLTSGENADEEVHRWTGILARIMASEELEGHELNSLLDDAFASLEALGNETFAALLQDRIDSRTFVRFLRDTARRHPRVYRDVFGSLDLASVLRWTGRLARDNLSSVGPRKRPYGGPSVR